MKHLIICREYPPAPSGGIGTYVSHISRLLAESGETVHVIGELWEGAEKAVEEQFNGNLIIHRIPYEDWKTLFWPKASSLIASQTARALFASAFPAQSFSWQAGLLAERLVEDEGIDVIEAQDYEAPLYHFQLRRAQGQGPKRHPPCFIHLHSPTEFIARHNEWNPGLLRWVMAKQLEDYSISAADGWLCPSRFFARQAEARYRLPQNVAEIIPYPLGGASAVDRDNEIWSNGSICHVGRLEKRKGIVEWIGAAVAVAARRPHARFEFVGANVLGSNRILSEELLDRIIPRHLRDRFVFHGPTRRSDIPQLLKRARIAVVPSRWDNFPNACIETMASGLPVIASRQGGMVEMITDGRSGWLADNASVQEFEAVLVRALDTPPATIAAMGRDAARSIREVCDNQTVVEKHLAVRRRLVEQGARRSLNPPASPPSLEPSAAAADGERQERRQERLALLRCLIGNPKITLRVLQEKTAKLARRA